MYGKYKIASEDLSISNRTENTEKTMILLEIVLFLESLGWIFSHKKSMSFLLVRCMPGIMLCVLTGDVRAAHSISVV